MTLACVIALPADFRAADILAFHKRDPLMVAERVGTDTLQKGISWEGRAACLGIAFQAGHAHAELAVDGPSADGGRGRLERMVRRMLGLTQPIEDFERRYRTHPLLGPLIARRPGLRVPLAPTPFEALTWAIAGQQISVRAAVSLRRNLIEAAGLRHSGGLLCYPDAGGVARLTEAELRRAGFSQAKARSLIVAAGKVVEGALPLDAWAGTLPVDDIRERLSRVRGIGPWTVDYTLLRGFGWLDGSLHGDAAFRRELQLLLGIPDRIAENDAKRWLAEFSPWRALVTAHLWAMRSAVAY
ncbi:MAG: hypothetical protein M0006_15510 [Magnetospirillum sp.]|nr:hypothetical protein [Magnetospirillum sp.]